MEAIAFALISYFGWGVGDIFGTVATRRLGTFSMTIWSTVIRVVALSLLAPFFITDLAGLTPGVLGQNLGLAIIFVFLFIGLNEAFRTANPSVAGAIMGSFGAPVAILSVLFLGETLDLRQVIAIAIIMVGVILSALNLNKVTVTPSQRRGTLIAILVLIALGIYFTFIKIPVREIGWFWPNYFSWLMVLPVYGFVRFRKIKINHPNYKRAALFLLLGALITQGAELSFNLGISHGFSSVVGPIAGSYTSLFVLLAFIIFKDPITIQQRFGVAINVLGIVLLSIFSS